MHPASEIRGWSGQGFRPDFSSRGIIISFRYLTVLRVQITSATHSLGGRRPWDITKVNASLLLYFFFVNKSFTV